jgi:hypothetical protein
MENPICPSGIQKSPSGFPAGSLSVKQPFNPGEKNRQPPDLAKRALQPSRSLGRASALICLKPQTGLFQLAASLLSQYHQRGCGGLLLAAPLDPECAAHCCVNTLYRPHQLPLYCPVHCTARISHTVAPNRPTLYRPRPTCTSLTGV